MKRYQIDDKLYSKTELINWAQITLDSAPEWKSDIAEFIIKWFDNSKTYAANSSGTTNKSKEIILKKSSMQASAELTNDFFDLDKSKTALLCLSAKYIGGKMMILRALISGANILLIEPSASPLEKIESREIHFCAMVPMQVQKSMNNPTFSYIKNIIIGGAAIPHRLEQELCLRDQNIYATFGMTETISHIALRKITGTKHQDVYKTMRGITVQTSKKTELKDCLVINAPHLSAELIETTDIVEILDSSNFKWKGRKDLIINTGGIKINPEEIERKIFEIIKDNEFFISSLPDTLLGEKIVLIIEGKEEGKNYLEKIKKVLPKYADPKKVFYLQDFIRTDNNKIKRLRTRDLII